MIVVLPEITFALKKGRATAGPMVCYSFGVEWKEKREKEKNEEGRSVEWEEKVRKAKGERREGAIEAKEERRKKS